MSKMGQRSRVDISRHELAMIAPHAATWAAMPRKNRTGKSFPQEFRQYLNSLR
jgi:hypothetical protein